MNARPLNLGSGNMGSGNIGSAGLGVGQLGSGNLGSGGWLLSLIMLLLLSMVLGLLLIWLSIDRNDTSYAIYKTQIQVEEAKAHVVKLEVERDSLLSPYVLGRKAEHLGMTMADPGQVRRLEIIQTLPFNPIMPIVPVGGN